MSTETTEIPKGVMQILLKRAEVACATRVEVHEGQWWDVNVSVRADALAADWLSGLNAMRLAP